MLHGPQHLDRNEILDDPVYFADRSGFYMLFDEITHALPYFDPSPEQRYCIVEVLCMRGGVVSLQVFFCRIN